MKGITLVQLRAVDAVARHGHFGRAAEASAISQPALSVQVRDLETSLGAPLFERGPRGAALTPLGAAVLQRARGVLRGVDEIGEIARAASGGLSGRLRLGVIPTIAPYLLPAALAAIRARWRDLEVAVRETTTAGLIEALGRGEIDAAVLALPVSEPGLEEAPLLDEPFVLVRPEGEPEPLGVPVDRLLLLEEGHCLRDQALAVCGMGRSSGLDAAGLGTLVQMVGAGLGVTLIPRMAVGVETRAAPVAVSALPGVGRTVGMVWRRATPLGDALREVAGVVGEAASARP